MRLGLIQLKSTRVSRPSESHVSASGTQRRDLKLTHALEVGMKNKVTGGLLLISFVFFAGSCSQSSQPARSASHQGKLGAATIGDVYKLNGEHPLIGLVDPRAHSIYVDNNSADRVKKALNVSADRGQIWVINLAALEGEYRVMPLEPLNLHQPLLAGMAAVSSKTKCLKSPKGECANMYDDDNKFVYSWQPTEDVFMCDWFESQDCTDIWREVTIKIFPEKNCKGNPTTKKEELPFCSPA